MSTRQDPRAKTPLPDLAGLRNSRLRLALVFTFLAVVAGLYAFGLHRYLDWEIIQGNIEGWREQTQHNRWTAAVVVFAAYVTLTSLSLPVSGMMSMLCGALFDHCLGTCLASVSATSGAALAFLSSRYLLHDWVRQHFAARLQAIDRGVRRDGAFYLFTLRLSPVPFFLVNVGMALTPMRSSTFVLVSWLGMLVPCFLFVNAGTEFAHIKQPSDALSPGVIGSLILLGAMPLVFRLLVARIRNTSR